VANDVHHVFSGGEPFEARALDGISIRIEEGEFVILAGRSGSGKSTLLRCLSGLLKPTKGRISIDGMYADRARKLIGLAVQSPERALFEKMLYDDIAFGPRNRGYGEDDAHRAVMDAIRIVGLDETLLKRPPRTLSQGQKRLAALAGIIAPGPKYLFLDEPTSGLDADGRRRIIETLISLNEGGTTIVAATHSLAHFRGVSSRLIVLDSGKIRFDGRPEGLLALDDTPGLVLPQSLAWAIKLRKRGIEVEWDADPEKVAELLWRAHESPV
jgi:energy-coupling factor transport system ATP-binding protein